MAFHELTNGISIYAGLATLLWQYSLGRETTEKTEKAREITASVYFALIMQ